MPDAVPEELVARVLARVDQLEAELVAAVSEAVRIPSVNPNYPGEDYDALVGGEGAVSNFVAGIYAELGAEVDVWAVAEGRDNAVGTIRGAGGGRSLIYNGHVDVVPPGDRAAWKSGDPFSGRVDGDRVWGRGATDMKGGVLAQAFAARALRDCGVTLAGDLILQAVAGEETGDHDIGVSATVARGYRADGAVVSEPSGPPVPLAVQPVSPGVFMLTITIPGKASHSSMRGQMIHAGGGGARIGVNAIDKGFIVYEALRRLEVEWGQTKSHPLFPPGHFTLLPGTVAGRPMGIDLPIASADVMTIGYCLWYPPDADPEAIQSEVEQQVAYAAHTDPWLRENPPRLDWGLHWIANDPGADELTATLAAAQERAAAGTRFAGPATINGFPAVEDASYLTAGGTPAISYGPGDLSVAHAPDEFVLIDELLCATRAFALLAMAWCGVAAS